MPKQSSLKFVVLIGVVSLFADMTYEGARSITGPYLALLGASGTVVGIVAGFGELVGYGLRLVSGYLSDRTKSYWPITLFGYVINMLSVPLLALTGLWQSAAALIILERTGKAIRNPPRDAMLSHATKEIGHGWGFGLHEALDQTGAMIGPLIVSFVLYLLYESVLDVPMRLNLMESFGFCNLHAWQIPKLPAICSPAAGFAIFASDLLRKFNLLVGARTQEPRKKSLWRFLFHQGSQKLSLHMKARACPACDHVAQFEAFHLTDLLDSITEKDFLEAFNASQGICLPHLFLIEQKHSNHPNFPLLLQLQVGKSQSLRKRLEEFIRKQDRRFQQEITADEAKAWRVAMEFLVGKPGVFNNEIRTDPRPNNGGMPVEETVNNASRIDGVAVGDLIAQIRTAKEVTIYQKQPLPTHLLEPLRDLVSAEMHPEVEIVAEDLSDVAYLRQLHSSGFELFYGVGLPLQPLIFMNSGRGFVVENNPEAAGVRSLSSKDAENLYYRLLWRRFGHAVSLTGVVKERDPEQSLFCLKLDSDRETWCRLRTEGPGVLPDVGQEVAVFGWEKWATHILDVIHLELLLGG